MQLEICPPGQGERSAPGDTGGIPPYDPIVLADGSRLLVRQLGRRDGDALAAAVGALSPESRYRRFLTAKPELTRREVSTLTDMDHHAREALVAFEPGGGPWAGVARYATFPDDPRTADVAVTVADRWQHRGVGSALLARLLARAQVEGIARLRAATLADNRAALRLLRRHGFARDGAQFGVVELSRELLPA
jgi:RimJ/RimL family protein N-acetyltransferase